ncbi:hypothetical protein [Tabrizicola aquatica]|uniref:hypothetical protein n=1 Tax=Tabrizicola aquatica TaxID=909926 RepID=UPI000CD291C8|nr:hypothetical protein [Tabrizicola aquatica]
MFEEMIPLLALFTLLAVIVLALVSKERTIDRKRDPNAPVSSLAKDGKYGGVAFLRPLAARVIDPRDPLARPVLRLNEVQEDRVNRALY